MTLFRALNIPSILLFAASGFVTLCKTEPITLLPSDNRTIPLFQHLYLFYPQEHCT